MTIKADEKYMAENQFKNMSITVSILDPANDYLQFYTSQNGDEVTFSDGGYYVRAFMLEDKSNFCGLERRGNELVLKGKTKGLCFFKTHVYHKFIRSAE